MKRVNLSVDLEDGVFKQSVEEAVIGYAKTVARETFNDVVSKEVERVSSLLSGELEEYPRRWNNFASSVASRMASMMESKLRSSVDLDKLVEQAVSKLLDEQWFKRKVEAAANKKVLEIVKGLTDF